MSKVEDITGRLASRRMLRLERVLRSLTIFFGMDENEMNAGMFREARSLLDGPRQFNPDRKYCDCPFGTCTGLDVERCVFRYVEDCEKDSHDTIDELRGTVSELLDQINATASDQERYDSVSVTGSGRILADEDDLDPKWETLRDLGVEQQILRRTCPSCGGMLTVRDAFSDTGRPSRLQCASRQCLAIWRIDWTSENRALHLASEDDAT